MSKTLKEIVVEKHGSIDTFMQETKIDIGRTYLYKLLNREDMNPTISAIVKIAQALDMDPLDVASEFSTRYRDIWARNK